jgi:Tfp pilus assembly major pilin PilA
MKKRFSPVILAACVSAALISNTAISATTNIVKDIQVSQITKQAWLRGSLPESTILYARVPSIWTSISYKDDSFKYALGNQAYTDTVKKIQQASGQWVTKAEDQLKPFLSLLAGQLNGPIEIAALVGSPMPKLLISASLNYENTDQLQLLIDSLIKSRLIKSETQKMADGAGQLTTDVGPVPYRWDAKNKRLNLLVSFGGADIATLDSTFAKLQPNTNSPMLANEAQMDSSQQGLYVWYNNELAYPTYEQMIPSHSKQQLVMAGVPDMKSLALGWGVSNEKGRLKLMLEAPTKGLIRSMIPTNNNNLDIKTAGEPNLSALIAFPSLEQFKRIEQMALQMSPDAAAYNEIKAGFKAKLGFEIEDIFAALGPEFVVIADKAGEYSAVRIQDKAALDNILTHLQKIEGAALVDKTVNGEQISYLKLPSMFGEKELAEMKDIPFFVTDMLTKISTHLYWQVEGDYLILSELPQVLLDRKSSLVETTLSQWITDKQKQDFSSSTLAITGAMQQAPRRLYYIYLQMLQVLADITGAQIDTFSLPTAKQLALPETGTLGFQLDSSDKKIAMEFTFESTPADILLSSNGIQSAATLGVLAAVAIPAYQDYTLKAAATSALFKAENIKLQVNDIYTQQGRYPNAEEASEIKATVGYSRDYKVQVEADTGKIIVNLKKRYSKRLEFTPTASVNSIDWQCGTNLKHSARPTGCKQSLR